MSEVCRPGKCGATGATNTGATTSPEEKRDAALSAVAQAAPAYSALTAKSAATALVRMFMEQGVFRVDFSDADSPDDSGAPAEGLGASPAHCADDSVSAIGVEPTEWERAGSAVALAEHRRIADSGPQEPDATSLRLMNEIMRRVGPDTPTTAPTMNDPAVHGPAPRAA